MNILTHLKSTTSIASKNAKLVGKTSLRIFAAAFVAVGILSASGNLLTPSSEYTPSEYSRATNIVLEEGDFRQIDQ